MRPGSRAGLSTEQAVKAWAGHLSTSREAHKLGVVQHTPCTTHACTHPLMISGSHVNTRSPHFSSKRGSARTVLQDSSQLQYPTMTYTGSANQDPVPTAESAADYKAIIDICHHSPPLSMLDFFHFQLWARLLA